MAASGEQKHLQIFGRSHIYLFLKFALNINKTLKIRVVPINQVAGVMNNNYIIYKVEWGSQYLGLQKLAGKGNSPGDHLLITQAFIYEN